MTNKEQKLNLINQLITEAEAQDKEFKLRMLTEHQAEKSIGEGWMVFHLKALRELIQNE